MAIVGRQAASTRGFFPVPLDSLDSSELGLDLYIRTSPDAPPALYGSAGLAFGEEDKARLLEQGVSFLYVSVEQHAAYTKMISGRVSRVLTDETMPGPERRDIVTGVCARLIEDAVGSGSPESMQSLFEVGNTIGRIAATEGDAAFSCLLDMSGHDFYTATHMMNVSIGCGLLARALRPGDTGFSCAMIRGGLVHDLGKCEIAGELLNKEGKLTDEEFEALKAHPMSGVRMLRELGVTDPLILEVTRDHHEHIAGTGYPRGVDAATLGVGARIAAIVDVYDALTSARPYRAAIAWADALEMMSESCGLQFDAEIFGKWKTVVREAAEEHADELPSPTAVARGIDDLLPHDQATRESIREKKAKLGIVSRYTGREKRVHERVNCSIRAAVSPVRADGTPAGEGGDRAPKHSFDARLLDISRCGVRFSCHQRFEPGATVHLRASLGAGKHLDTLAEVVRPSAKANRDGLWEFGCKLRKSAKAA